MSNTTNDTILEYASDTIDILCELRAHRDSKALQEAQYNLDIAIASNDLDNILIKTNEAKQVIYDTTKRREKIQSINYGAERTDTTSQVIIW